MSGEEFKVSTASTDAVKVSKKDAKKAEEAKKEAARQAEALKLIQQISGQKEYANLQTDEIRKNLEKDLKALYSKKTKDDAERGVDSFQSIDKDMYKSSLEVLESQMAKVEEARQAQAQALVRKIATMAKYTDDKDIRGFVRTGLQLEYEQGNISKEVYDYARKYGETRKGTHVVKSALRGIFGGTKESSEVYKSVGNNNNVEKVRNSQEGPQYDAKLKAKLDDAGISKDDIYFLGDNFVGAEAVVTYSDKRKQGGELQFITDKLNLMVKENGKEIQFSEAEVKDIMKGAGYKIEKKVDIGKTIRDTAIPTAAGAAVGVPLALRQVLNNQTQDVNLIYGSDLADKIHQDQSNKEYAAPETPFVTAALAAGLAALGSIDKQVSRVEDKAVPAHIDPSIKTYEQYIDFVKNSTSMPKMGKAIAMKIAAFYATEDGKLNTEELVKAYKQAGGSSAEGWQDSSVLNFKEALALLAKLEGGQIKVKKPVEKPADKPVEKAAVLVQKETEEVLVDNTKCYKVKGGDDWYRVVMGKYKPKTAADAKAIVRILKDSTFEAMKKDGTLPKGVTSSKDGFFPKVGENLCLPPTITVNNNIYEYDESGKVIPETASSSYKGTSYSAKTNPFLAKAENEHYVVTTDGSGPIYEGSDKAKADKAVADFKANNPGKEVTVSTKELPKVTVAAK